MKKVLFTIALVMSVSKFAHAEIVCGKAELVPIFKPPGYATNSFIFKTDADTLAAVGNSKTVNAQILKSAKSKKMVCVDATVETDSEGNRFLLISRLGPAL